MTEETPKTTGVSPIALSLAYIGETLTDNAAFFLCLGAGIAMVYIGIDVPEWLTVVIGLGANKYMKA